MHENPHHLAPRTIEWLGNWLSGGGDAAEVPGVALVELNNPKFRPRAREVVLYRGLKPKDKLQGEVLRLPGFSSWTYSEEMAHNFGPLVMRAEVGRDRVLVDTTRLDRRFVESECSGFPDEEEVILHPGDYRVSPSSDE